MQLFNKKYNKKKIVKLDGDFFNVKDFINSNIGKFFTRRGVIDNKTIDEFEDLLLSADVGVVSTDKIIKLIKRGLSDLDLSAKFSSNVETLIQFIQANLIRIIRPYEGKLVIDKKVNPYIILVVGVNGSGKTTTIGKITHALQLKGKSVMLAAGDTYRSAAVEQLKIWGMRNKVPVIFQSLGLDSASVIYDAIEAARIRNIDVVIADTSGRLHTKEHLMNELKKIIRVIKRFDIEAPHEILMVLDACIGQNSIAQTQAFNSILPLTGIVVAKLDGTARGGIIFSIIDQLNLPIKFVCTGENIEDLYPFNAHVFVKNIFSLR